jgi:hypothetical protein
MIKKGTITLPNGDTIDLHVQCGENGVPENLLWKMVHSNPSQYLGKMELSEPVPVN